MLNLRKQLPEADVPLGGDRFELGPKRVFERDARVLAVVPPAMARWGLSARLLR